MFFGQAELGLDQLQRLFNAPGALEDEQADAQRGRMARLELKDRIDGFAHARLVFPAKQRGQFLKQRSDFTLRFPVERSVETFLQRLPEVGSLAAPDDFAAFVGQESQRKKRAVADIFRSQRPLGVDAEAQGEIRPSGEQRPDIRFGIRSDDGEAGAVGEGAPQIIQQRQRVVGVLGAGQQKNHGLVFRIARRGLGGGKHGERNALNPLHINKFFDRVAGTEGKRLKGHDGRET